MKKINILILITLLAISLSNISCKSETNQGTQSVLNLVEIDYSQTDNWASAPAEICYPYDIFYIYPTVLAEGTNGKMDFAVKAQRDVALANVKGATILMKDFANIYAPLYRQSTMDAFVPFDDFKVVVQEGQTGIDDVEKAFLYYIKYLNNNRPFIIFGHSQGAAVGFEILKRNFNNPKISKNFVAAYLSGMLLMPNDLVDYPYLKFTKNPDDIGVILVWNLQAPNVGNNFFVHDGGLGVNPANWQVNNQKSVARDIQDPRGFIAHELEATLDMSNGATIIELDNPKKYEMSVFGNGVYHIGNISLYMNSISENMFKRFQIYSKKLAQ